MLTLTHVWIIGTSTWITIVHLPTSLAIIAIGIVLAIIAHTARDIIRGIVDRGIKMTSTSVIVAVAHYR